MTASIILAHDTSRVTLDLGERSVCVRHRTYPAPCVVPDCLHLTWDDFEPDPRRAMHGRDTLVLVGLNKIMTPSNRTAAVVEVLFNLSDTWRKLSVDRTLFAAEPWRAWFHFGLVGAPYREYTYSYLAESHWRAYQEGVRTDDPFAVETIAHEGEGVVRSTYDRYFRPVTIERVEVSAAIHSAYQDLKTRCFDEEHTAQAIVTRLARFAQDACPTRRVPTPARFFDLEAAADGLFGQRLVQTDLKVDDYLVGRLIGLVALTDAVGRSFA